MSITIQYVDGKKVRAERTYNRTQPSPTFACKDGETFLLGDLFDVEPDEIAQCGWRENPDALNDYVGAFSIACADDEKCSFALDMNGTETWFLYFKDKTFILSDSFWDIVRIIRPTYEDVDEERARASLLAPSPFGDTLIKHLKRLTPCQCGEYSATRNELVLRKYREFKYSNEVSDVETAVANVDAILDDAMAAIRRKFGDVKYGVGISGGLDSRTIPHYAQKFGMDLVGYNVCVPRPRGVLLARSCKNAKRIAKIFNVPLSLVKWSPDDVEDKIKTKVAFYPLGAGRNSFKFERNLPEFDVMLNGGSGEIVGGALPSDVDDLSREQLIARMVEFFSSRFFASAFGARVGRALDWLFGFKREKVVESAVCSLLTSEDLRRVDDETTAFVDQGIARGQSNLEIFEDYLINVCSSNNRYGGFESMLGQRRSLSIYVPFLLKETLRWSPELLFDRKVLNELIVRKIPEVRDVRAELFGTAPNKKNSTFNRIAAMASFLLRGNGTAVDQYWLKKRRVKNALIQRLNNGRVWFNAAFKTDGERLSRLVSQSGEAGFMINVWEMKTLFDFLETQEYLKFDFARAR